MKTLAVLLIAGLTLGFGVHAIELQNSQNPDVQENQAPEFVPTPQEIQAAMPGDVIVDVRGFRGRCIHPPYPNMEVLNGRTICRPIVQMERPEVTYVGDDGHGAISFMLAGMPNIHKPIARIQLIPSAIGCSLQPASITQSPVFLWVGTTPEPINRTPGEVYNAPLMRTGYTGLSIQDGWEADYRDVVVTFQFN